MRVTGHVGVKAGSVPDICVVCEETEQDSGQPLAKGVLVVAGFEQVVVELRHVFRSD